MKKYIKEWSELDGLRRKNYQIDYEYKYAHGPCSKDHLKIRQNIDWSAGVIVEDIEMTCSDNLILSVLKSFGFDIGLI